MIEFGDVVRAVAIAVALQLGISVVGFLVFRAQATEWHKANQGRFGKIERALGIEDPDDTAFPRRSEFNSENKRIWEEFENHDGRIATLETKNHPRKI